jgi:diguanylate cyclase (GGDEF)-like protein
MPQIYLWELLGLAGIALAGLSGWMYWRQRERTLAVTAELARLASQASVAPLHDPLTGLLSRSGFDVALDQEARRVAGGGSFCLLYVGLDNFDVFNDAFGHAVGDLLLKEVARRLSQCGGESARLCRLTAGEFAFVVDGEMLFGLGAAVRVADALNKPFQFESAMTTLTCSVGIVVYPEHGARANLLGNAGMAMRRIKREGGGGCCQFEPRMALEVIEKAVLVNDLRNALELGQFELHFQPKVDALSLQVTAAEALLRWNHPKHGMVSPAVFIPLAERYGLIGAIGNWVIEEACRKAAGWREKGLRMRVAVNISGDQMRESDLVERIERTLRASGIQSGRFTCEITESVAMEDTRVTQLTFEKMRSAGFHVSIDDFGTGYSSLSTLRKLPAAELKIDRSFVTDIEESEDARSIARSIVSLASALNLRVVAEGVETVGQRDLLVGMGCNELQGYLFSRPVPADVLQQMALDNKLGDAVPFRQSLFSETSLDSLN